MEANSTDYVSLVGQGRLRYEKVENPFNTHFTKIQRKKQEQKAVENGSKNLREKCGYQPSCVLERQISNYFMDLIKCIFLHRAYIYLISRMNSE